ncbi:MAG: ABC transporter ATP-binding protein [Actinomycetota bacterium]
MTVAAIEHLTKRFGSVTAVNDLTFAVEAGSVTGFLGPNGAGKTTTLRALLGLVTPSSGTATIGGRRYRDLVRPLQTVGAVLESSGFHPARSAVEHLRVVTDSAGLAPGRADEVLALVGLSGVAGRAVKGFSLGMRQRLSLATALLGEPGLLILDEPANGLDPDGVRWLRAFLRAFADHGGAVIISSHVLSEVAQLVDEVIIIAQGRLVTHSSLDALTEGATARIHVRTPQAETLRFALEARGIAVEVAEPDVLLASASTPGIVGRAALDAGAEIHEMWTERSNLEDIFLGLTGQQAVPS